MDISLLDPRSAMGFCVTRPEGLSVGFQGLSGDPRDTGIRAFSDAATKRPHYYWIFRGIDHRSVCANCPDGVLREAAQAHIAVCARTVNAAGTR
jgi:hypothetical protein